MKRIFPFAILLLSRLTMAAPAMQVEATYMPLDGGLRNGPWRAALQREDGNNIVFNFDVKDSLGRKILLIKNADERLLVDDVTLKGDSVLIRLPFFESQLKAALTKDGDLEGVWLKRGATNYSSVPFRAYHGQSFRFAPSGSEKGGSMPVADISGRWRAVFHSHGGKDTSLRIGEFRQNGNRVTGTFLDPTGDFRYLEGIVDRDSLRMSCFDGGHAYLFTARVAGKELSGGQFFAGGAGHEIWSAVRDSKATLPDEFTLTKWKKDAGPLHFTFRDIGGKTVSFSDSRFKGKVVLIQIMGSWCPNCMDETRFLSSFYDQYHSKGVEVVALAYERSTDFTRSQTSLRSFQQRFQVKYPILITGVAVGDTQRTEKTLPILERIVGFPTTIFVDRQGNILRIHTGFNGPGTGEHYEEQKKEFNRIVDAML